MTDITIPMIPEPDAALTLATVSGTMDSLKRHAIDKQPWKTYETGATAAFAIAHTGNNLLVKFYVTESDFSASLRTENDEVSRDNCVELFIAFDNENYYNLEFNCLGSAKVAYGSERNGRILLDAGVIGKIKRHAAITSEVNGELRLSWDLLIVMPKETFTFTAIDTLEGINCRANFYKCGDGLKEPHFLSWRMVETGEPDFHQPAFFGEVNFMPGLIYAGSR